MAAPVMAPPQQGKPQIEMMARPEGNFADCPPGLEYLTQIDQLLVHQQIEILEVVTGLETNNKYVIKNALGQQVYFMEEDTNFCMRQMCGPGRGYTMHITDNLGQEVIRITREFKCCAGCSWCACSDCCAMEVVVEAPVGQVVSICKQKRSKCVPQWTINDPTGAVMFHVEGPEWCVCQNICCTGDVEFKVLSADRQTEIGVISKQWAGLVQEMFTSADNFGVRFPVDLDVRAKTGMLAALLSVEFQIFEQQRKNK